jgi:exosome complex exonuclease DIS3/RRP44
MFIEETEIQKEIKRTLRVTTKGRLLKNVLEVYQRDNISCGWAKCELCPQRKDLFNFDDSKALFIVDFDILKTYFDCIFNAKIHNILITQSTVEKLKASSENLYKRLKNVVNLEKWRNIYVYPNEFCTNTYVPRNAGVSERENEEQRSLKALAYFSNHFGSDVNVYHVTNDAEFAARIAESELKSLLLFQLIQNFAPNREELVDFLGFGGAQDHSLIRQNAHLSANFSPHLEERAIVNQVTKGELFRGKVKFNRLNNDEARVFSRVLNRDIMLRSSEQTNRALEGDIVAVELLDESQWIKEKPVISFLEEVVEEEEPKMTGEDLDSTFSHISHFQQLKKRLSEADIIPVGIVKGVIRRDLRTFVGEMTEIKPAGLDFSGLVLLADSRLPKVLIKSQHPDRFLGKKIIVSIDEWPECSKYPLGHIVKVLGNSGDTKVENDAILFEFNVETREFSQAVLDCLPKDGEHWKIPQSEINKRLDLRDQLVCSVDPPGCRDIDDALHCRQLDNGLWEVGVHIADVSYFVRSESPLDLEAANRCTTVYLVDRRTDMLPKVLTEHLCSLVANQDRLAFSVIWTMDPKDASIKSTTFNKTVIRSQNAYSYQQAQERIDDQSDSAPLTLGLRRLLTVAKHLKRKRIEAGALQLASTQVKFKMDETLNPTDVSYYDMRETNSMVEEFMLLANIAVADRITEAFPTSAILRKHSSPKPEMIKQFSKVLALMGFNLDFSSSKSLANSLDSIQRPNDAFFNTLVRIITTRCMHEALYFCSADFDLTEYRHYGLAADIYTHFTSPIRRYADLLVHRLLSASIGVESLPEAMCNKTNLNTLCDRLNMRNRNARNASRASSEFFSYLFFKDKVFEEDGIISSIQSNGFTVVISKYGFEGLIEFDDHDVLSNQKLLGTDDKRFLKFVYKGKEYNLFSWLKVKLSMKLVNYRKIVSIEIFE